MTTDPQPLRLLRASSPAAPLKRSILPHDFVANLDEVRLRREGSDPGSSRTPVTVLVLAVSGSVDETWIQQFGEASLLASHELAPTDQVAAFSKSTWEPREPEPTTAVSAGQIRMDLAAMRVEVAGRTVELTHQEFLLLRTLMQSPRRVLSRRQLPYQAWPYSDIDGERTVDVHVRRVRVKLGSEARQIVTVRGFGYRFDPSEPTVVGMSSSSTEVLR